jgi:hypothetical protein
LDLYDRGNRSDKHIPVTYAVPGSDRRKAIPVVLRAFHQYYLPEHYEELYRLVTRQPAVLPPKLAQDRRVETPASKRCSRGLSCPFEQQKGRSPVDPPDRVILFEALTVGVVSHRGGPVRKDAYDSDVLRQHVEDIQHIAVVVDHLGYGRVVAAAAVLQKAGTLKSPGDDVEACILGSFSVRRGYNFFCFRPAS